MAGIAEDSVRFAHSGPSHNLLRPASRNRFFGGCGSVHVCLSIEVPCSVDERGSQMELSMIMPVSMDKPIKS